MNHRGRILIRVRIMRLFLVILLNRCYRLGNLLCFSMFESPIPRTSYQQDGGSRSHALQPKLTSLVGNPVPGVQVQSTSLGIDVVTGNDGSFIDSTSRILESWSEFDLSVRDIDGAENGEYENLDTFLFAHNLNAPLHLQVKPKHDDR